MDARFGYDAMVKELSHHQQSDNIQDNQYDNLGDVHIVCKTCDIKLRAENFTQVQKVPIYGDLSLEEADDHWVQVLQCRQCQNCVSLFLLQQWWTVEELLTGEQSRNGLFQVVSRADRLVLYILSQIIFPQNDKQLHMTFLCPPPGEFAKVMWKDGTAAGFYTLKEKGTLYSGCQCDSYELPIVDLIFIRPKFRRLGLASQMITDIAILFPDQDVGFSEPLSEPLTDVLWHFLCDHCEWRDHMWECSFTGGEGNCKNIWLHYKRMKRKRPPSPTSSQKDTKCKV